MPFVTVGLNALNAVSFRPPGFFTARNEDIDAFSCRLEVCMSFGLSQWLAVWLVTLASTGLFDDQFAMRVHERSSAGDVATVRPM